MILHAIDTVLVSDLNEAHLLPVDVSIEHLLPQKWQEKAWPISNNENAAAIRASLIHTIGNLTLVKKKLNSSLSRGHQSEKIFCTIATSISTGRSSKSRHGMRKAAGNGQRNCSNMQFRSGHVDYLQAGAELPKLLVVGRSTITVHRVTHVARV